ncbi:accessory gland protein Acp63F-like [Drosophila takahashii]|uniref:accessory gland protein Acp63F-like n=1 Tax=Drosophila takahashii TaxID=29030 RepID=UPI0038994E28
MLKLSIAFILVTSILGTEGFKCKDANYTIPSILRKACGIATECVYSGPHAYAVRSEDCKRQEQGLSPFLNIKVGKCPTGKPPCFGSQRL